ncbi:hypothetical protein GC173_01005 [bacterium]|nr:hypothetical protein [bacterium]
MCTLTLHRSGARQLLTFNRDERRSRAGELPPALSRPESGLAIAAPRDGAAQGTWIGVNSRGVAACILNGYRENDQYRHVDSTNNISRGRIIPLLLSAGGFRDVLQHIDKELDPRLFLSFTLVVIGEANAIVVQWDGFENLDVRRLDAEWEMITSSSWNRDAVLEWRREAFEAWIRSGATMKGDLPALHLLQPPDLAEWSPLMARAETATRSITQVDLDPQGGRAEMLYWPVPFPTPDLAPASRLRLALE